MQQNTSIEDSPIEAALPTTTTSAASQIEESVGKYVVAVAPIPPTMPCKDVLHLFLKDERLRLLPVVQEGVPVGHVRRNTFLERFLKPYALDLIGRRTVLTVMDTAPLLIDRHMSIDDASQLLLDNEGQSTCEGFIVVENGLYAGVGLVYSLLHELRARRQAFLYHLAHFDQLTGLPNRTLFYDRLGHALVQAQRSGQLVAVLFLDLDGFKAINDTMGHQTGDLLLQAVATRMMSCLRNGDTVARLGGDEFTILLTSLAQQQDAARIAQKLLDAVHQRFSIASQTIRISCSIGISLYPMDGDHANVMMHHADAAMYHAKELKHTYQFYAPDMNAAEVSRTLLYKHLQEALEQRQFVLHYQPKVDLRSGAVSGVEALVRWVHPERGPIPPADFIPLAEETGLILPLSEWILRTACAQAQAWSTAGTPVSIAVNISAAQMKKGNLLEQVRQVIDETGLAFHQLELELTETLLIQNVRAAVGMLANLKALGVRIALDDFGTGYSSLSYLHRFPIDTLKIDRAFIRDIGNASENGIIAKAIISLARSLNLSVVAEGVETEVQRNWLTQHDCDHAQGFFFSPPLPAEQIPGLLGVTTPSWGLVGHR